MNIIDPTTLHSYPVITSEGRNILRQYIKFYNQNNAQIGGSQRSIIGESNEGGGGGGGGGGAARDDSVRQIEESERQIAQDAQEENDRQFGHEETEDEAFQRRIQEIRDENTRRLKMGIALQQDSIMGNWDRGIYVKKEDLEKLAELFDRVNSGIPKWLEGALKYTRRAGYEDNMREYIKEVEHMHRKVLRAETKKALEPGKTGWRDPDAAVLESMHAGAPSTTYGQKKVHNLRIRALQLQDTINDLTLTKNDQQLITRGRSSSRRRGYRNIIKSGFTKFKVPRHLRFGFLRDDDPVVIKAKEALRTLRSRIITTEAVYDDPNFFNSGSESED